MVSIHRHFLSTFLSLFNIILLFHLFGCFAFSSHHHDHHGHRRSSKRSPFSFLKRLFSPKPTTKTSQHEASLNHVIAPSPASSTRSLRSNIPLTTQQDTNNNAPYLDYIHPCTICGEVFNTTTQLQAHQATNHAVSELVDGENIVRIIFKMGWPEKAKTPTIHRILKIHNSPRILARFEEYRESVKSKAAKMISTLKDERCIADGNELLRFYCTTFMCELSSSICGHQYCNACGIIRSGFSAKMDGISTLPTSWKAHVSVPEDLEEEFGFMHVKRALLVCRVVAGRVGCDPSVASKEDPGFDSLVCRGSGGFEEDELLVFSPRAVLPCFVIVYTV